MSFLAEPNDANYSGNVHGGKVMKWIDEIGYALSVQYTKKYCVTKFVDDIEFLKPIHIGDLVKLEAEIIKVGKTSLYIVSFRPKAAGSLPEGNGWEYHIERAIRAKIP